MYADLNSHASIEELTFMDHITESASLESLIAYIKLISDMDQTAAAAEAQDILSHLTEMQHKGLIEGWYFNEQGHFVVDPCDRMHQQIAKMHQYDIETPALDE
jgi:hypothetical protein